MEAGVAAPRSFDRLRAPARLRDMDRVYVEDETVR
jgi:hypothetical protein